MELNTELVRQYVETGSHEAANSLVRQYRKFVYATALRFTEDYDDADDIAQEVFIKALDSLHKFKGNSSIKTWLYRITVNLALNHKRKRKFLNFFSLTESKVPNDEILVDSTNPEKLLENKEFEINLIELLSRLPEKQRETFALRYFDELSYEEISEMLGTSIGGLKANYHQAVKKLSQILKNNNDGVREEI
ncbi:MAG: RNA polymerase sigma factor [Candidatus Kapaibacterium sp.]|nr:RNA polymerase sigma factor [Candidatus Kapabacteria bacterium]